MTEKFIHPALSFCILVVFLAACAGTPTPAMPTLEPVTLKFTYLRYSGNYEALAEEYHQLHPEVTIQLNPMPVVMQAYAQNLTPESKDSDALRIPATNSPADLYGLLMPLDSLISSSKNFPLDDLVPGTLDALKLNGKQIAIPAGISPLVIFYSPKKFAELGAEPPRPDWTLEEFNQLAKSITNLNESEIGSPKYTAGFCTTPNSIDSFAFAYLFGGGWVDNLTSPTRATLDRPENIAAVTWYAGLKNDLGVLPEKYQPNDIFPLMQNRNCGLWTDSIDLSGWNSFAPGDATPLPMPRVESAASLKNPLNLVFLDGYAIPATSKHPEAAFAWIRFLMTRDPAAGRQIPPLRSVIESHDYGARASKAIMMVAKSLEPGVLAFNIEISRDERFFQLFNLYSEAVTRVMDKEVDARRALEEAQLKAEKVFK